MATANEENRMMRYNEPKAYVWCIIISRQAQSRVTWPSQLGKKYRKKIKAVTFPENLRLLFEALGTSRSDEHTGGGGRKCELWKLRQEVIISSDDLVFPRIVISVRTNFHFYIYDRRI